MIALWPPSDGEDTDIKEVGNLVHRAAQVSVLFCFVLFILFYFLVHLFVCFVS